MAESGKRVRATNFTAYEKELLYNIIYKHKHIIENKRTDQSSCEDKYQAWKLITEEFNSASPNLCHRSIECLKKFYNNKKMELRKQVAEEKKEILLTGGGPLPNFKTDGSQELLVSMINKKSVVGLPNPFGGDNGTIQPSTSKNITLEINSDKDNVDEDNELILEPEDIHMIEEIEEPSTSNWKKYIPKNLMDAKSKPLKTLLKTNDTDTPKRKMESNRRRPTTTVKALTSSDLAEKYNLLIDKKLAIADFQMRNMEEDQIRLKEEHNMKIELFKLDIEIKKETLKKIKNNI